MTFICREQLGHVAISCPSMIAFYLNNRLLDLSFSYNGNLELVTTWAWVVEFALFKVHVVDFNLIVNVLHISRR
jgi:hypothetical protein